MRAQAMAVSVLLAVTTGAVLADDVPNLSGSWKLVGITSGRDERPVPDHVLTIRQEGPVVTMETVISGGSPRVTTLTIGARKGTTDRFGVETKGRVEKQALIVEENSSRPRSINNFFVDTSLEARRKNGDGSASRRSMLSYPIEPNCVDAVRRSTYRPSGDGATLEVMKQDIYFLCGPEVRWLFKRQ